MNVLIVEDDDAVGNVLAMRCRQLGLASRIARTATCALDMLDQAILNQAMPDLILLDVEIPCKEGVPAARHGILLLEKLPRSVFGTIPIIVFSGSDDEPTKACCRAAGAIHVQKTPDAWETLKPAIIKLLRLESKTTVPPASRTLPQLIEPEIAAPLGPKILCVDDDPHINLAIGLRLRQLGAFPVRAFSGSQGFQVALHERPDLVLTDLHMPDGEGNYLIGRLRANPLTQHIPVIVLTAVCNPGVARTLRSLGADGFLNKPLDIPSVIAELSRFVRLPNI